MKKRAAIAILGLGVFILGMLVGIVRTDFFLADQEAKLLAPYIGEDVEVRGVVVDDPERREKNLRATIEVENTGGKIIAILPRDTDISFGNHLTLVGDLELPEKFETDAGRIFDYPSYLRVRGVSAIMNYAEVIEISPGGISLRGSLFALKHLFEDSLEKIFVEPQSALAEGILLGEKRGLSEDLRNAFIISGLIHVVVLSGYNISVIAEWVMRAFSFLPMALGLTGAAITIILFVVMTGASATAVRACIMATIAILGRYLNRPNDALRALIAAIVLMALWNPLSLLHDPSFILSVLATFGLITISPWVEQKILWVPEKFGLRAVAASTIAVQIYVLPALLYMTGVLSFVSLPANILALPTIPLAMIMSFFAGALAIIHPLLAVVPAFVADMLLRFVILVAEISAALPFSSTIVSTFPLWVVIVSYIPLSAWALWLHARGTSRHS